MFSGTIWQIIGDTSAFGLFILIALMLMSIVSWIIIIHKWREYRAIDYQTGAFTQHFGGVIKIGDSMSHAKSLPCSPLSQIYIAGCNELEHLYELQAEPAQKAPTQFSIDDFEVVEMTMLKAQSEQISKMERKVVFLATTANSAPFMGLMGTVVGIMNSFWSIGERGSASLAVVAPGIAEALLATIVGLGAAIPAVIAYNWASSKTKFMNEHTDNFILEFIARAKKEFR